MKILIVSDTHRRDGNLRAIIEKQSPFDMLIHLGDTEGSEIYFKEWVNNDNCVIHVVRGNNDFFSRLDREKVVLIGGYTAFMTHGHRYGVNYGTDRLVEVAKENGASIAMYGHTHKPQIELVDGVYVINPGSISQPRQEGRIPSYILMEIDRFDQVHFTLNFIE